MARTYNRNSSTNKFQALTMRQKYDAYLGQYNKKAERMSMEDAYTEEEFEIAYKAVYNKYVDSGSKPNNVIRSVVSQQQLMTRDLAKQMQKELGGKQSDYYKLDDVLEVGKEVVGFNPITGDPWRYKQTKNQAFFAYMRSIGMIEKAEEEWGY